MMKALGTYNDWDGFLSVISISVLRPSYHLPQFLGCTEKNVRGADDI